MGQRIDGKELAEQHKQRLTQKLKELVSKTGRKPAIVSFCNTEDLPSVKYTKMKQDKAEEIGINFIVESYDTTTSHEELRSKVKGYNHDPNIDGIMVQLPVPLDLVVFQKELLELIYPQKDVDGLTEVGQEFYLPATVKSVISILESELSEWTNFKIAVIGATGEIGRPLVKVLTDTYRIQKLVQITRSLGNINSDLQDCEIIISVVGHENLIRPEMIKAGSVLIDVGLGDFDPQCFDKSSKYTTKYGGVGPMTVISLMENVVISFEKRTSLE